MKKHLRFYPWLPGVGLAILFAITVGLGSAPAHAHHCKGKHQNDPGCPGGNDPAAEIAVSVTFDCPNPTRTCSSSVSLIQDRVQGDSTDPYTDGSEDVRAHIRESGVLQLRTDAKGGKPGERNIYWDFGRLTLPSGLEITNTDALELDGYGHATVIQVGRGTSNGLNFLDLDVIMETAQTNLWAQLIIKPDSGAKQHVFIRFEANSAVDQCPASSTPTTVTVTRLSDASDPGQWEIVGADGAVACEQVTGQDVVLGPFRFVVTEL